MIYGYCRISTGKQSIDRQIRNIKAAYLEAIIVEEVYTGTKFQGRDKLDKILKTVREGDAKLSRWFAHALMIDPQQVWQTLRTLIILFLKIVISNIRSINYRQRPCFNGKINQYDLSQSDKTLTSISGE